jgi:hypothetical protein
MPPEEILHRVQAKKNIPRTIKNEAKWIGRILRRNCLLKYVIERMAVEGYK